MELNERIEPKGPKNAMFPVYFGWCGSYSYESANFELFLFGKLLILCISITYSHLTNTRTISGCWECRTMIFYYTEYLVQLLRPSISTSKTNFHHDSYHYLWSNIICFEWLTKKGSIVNCVALAPTLSRLRLWRKPIRDYWLNQCTLY